MNPLINIGFWVGMNSRLIGAFASRGMLHIALPIVFTLLGAQTRAQCDAHSSLSNAQTEILRKSATEFDSLTHETDVDIAAATSDDNLVSRMRVTLSHAQTIVQSAKSAFRAQRLWDERGTKEFFESLQTRFQEKSQFQTSPAELYAKSTKKDLRAAASAFEHVASDRCFMMRVKITSDPPKANIEGRPMSLGFLFGSTPTTMDIPWQVWTIHIKKAGYADDDLTFDPFNDPRRVVNIILKPQDRPLVHNNTRKEPVVLSSAQSESFAKNAKAFELLREHAQSILDARAKDSEALHLILRQTLTQATDDVVRAQALFLQTAEPSQVDAAKAFFGTILDHHAAASHDLESTAGTDGGRQFRFIQVAQHSNGSDSAELVIRTLSLTAAAFDAVSKDEALTLHVQVISYPPLALIDYHLKGDAYQPYPDPTTATITLNWGVWYFRVTMAGYQTEEKQFDPYSDTNRAVVFSLQRK